MHKAWCITDGSNGMISQAIGLSNAMGLVTIKKTVKIRNPWHRLPTGWYPTPRYAIQNLDEFPLDTCPKYVISCGKRSVYASRHIKSCLGEKVTTIHIQDPRISSRNFDYVIAPFYDKISGPNVITNQYNINHITPELLQKEIQAHRQYLPHTNKPITLITLGGTNRHFDFTEADIAKMSDIISALAASNEMHYFILFSRRTPEKIKDYCIKRFETSKNIDVWQHESCNPYLALLGLASNIILTCDSTSMLSEAISTQKPTYVYQLPLKKQHSRIQHFIDKLVSEKIIQKLQYPLPHCQPNAVNETFRIAQKLITLTQTSTI